MDANASERSADVLRGGARATLRYLATSHGWDRIALAEGEFHTGDDPIKADREAQRVFEQYVYANHHLIDNSVYDIVGEESIRALPGEFEPGTRVIVVDPLDGSTQWAIFSHAFCVAAYCLVADADRSLKLESAVVATPQHTFTWRADAVGFEFRPLHPENAAPIVTQSAVEETPYVTPSIAFTAFKPKDRKAAVQLMEAFGDWNVMPIGGNPVTPYVVTSGLTAAVTLRPQAGWDAVGILLASSASAFIGTLDGTRISPATFHGLFERVVLEGDVRLVPALIVAKSEERYDEIVRRIAPFVTEDAIISPPIQE